MTLPRYNLTKFAGAFFCVVLLSLNSINLSAAEYIGNTSCDGCHETEFNDWMGSDHQRSMLPATSESVLGDFSDVTVEFHNIRTRFYRADDAFLVDTLDENGESKTFQVSYTFGHDPLQQYLIEIGEGHTQAFSIAWDSRPASEGGQRWFHLQPDENITPEHPFYWTNHFQNWNSRCAECHSTDLQKNYDPQTSSYDTQWSEVNVSCEGCHGPASDHVEMAQAASFTGELAGFEKTLQRNSSFVFQDDQTIAQNVGTRSDAQIDTCAVCHSRRGVVGGYEAQQEYHQQYAVSFLNEGLYFADGQIQDEVFVIGSFLQSKMHQAGVSCSDCHNPHSTELKAPSSDVCQQCHMPAEYQATSHHRHVPESSGAQCVSCHMPETTYMQVDARADHSFSIPRPGLANKIGAPDACSNCHEDWSDEEAVSNYTGLFGEESSLAWAEANYEARRLNILDLQNILALASDTRTPAIIRASLLSQSGNFPARVTLESIQLNLTDDDPLVRRAAVQASAFLPPQQRLQLLGPLIEDQSKSVRMDVANQLADTFQAAQPGDQASLLALFEEYEQSLLLSQDSPGAQLNLATFYYRRGDRIRVERAYQRALEIEPGFVPVLLNLADLRREQGSEDLAEVLLKQALEIAPDSAAAHHSLGLLYIRERDMEAAEEELRIATEIEGSAPRYFYIYAIALENRGAREQAIEVLKESELTWPNQVESLLLLVSYLDQEGRGNELLRYLSNLSRIIPGNPDVAALVAKYANQR